MRKTRWESADIGEPTLKHFRPDDFHVVTGSREEFHRLHEPDAASGHGFKRGDRVRFGVFSIATFRNEYKTGKVSGIAGDFVRINGELFHRSAVKKV